MANKKRAKSVASRNQICVPKCCQQPRSHASKRRIDFSLYFFNTCSHINSSPSLPRPLQGGSRLKGVNNSCCITLAQCNNNMSQMGEKEGISSNSIERTSAGTELRHEQLLDRSRAQNRSGDAAVSLCSPNKSTSQITQCSDVQITPGTTMWARNAHRMWWPAKIIERRLAPVATNDQGTDGHILVQYYGNQELAWVDPGSLSEFDECFEERSCNPVEGFQEALKQALNKNEELDLCRQMDGSFDRLRNSSQHDEPGAQSNKWNESSSSREEIDDLERGRGKRKRKPKVHFDEVSFPNKPVKKMRRFRIMRLLGLAAPIGSPFSLTSSVRNC